MKHRDLGNRIQSMGVTKHGLRYAIYGMVYNMIPYQGLGPLLKGVNTVCDFLFDVLPARFLTRVVVDQRLGGSWTTSRGRRTYK